MPRRTYIVPQGHQLLANETEGTRTVIITRWLLEKTLTFNGHRFCIPKFKYSTLQQTTRLLVISDVLLVRNQLRII